MKFGTVPPQTILCLGEGRQEFASTNDESLRKKIQMSYNKIKLLKKKGNKISLDTFAVKISTPSQ